MGPARRPVLTKSAATHPGLPAPDPRDSDLETGQLTSAGKAVGLLDCFRGRDRSVGVTDIAVMMEIPKSTAFRLLAQLEERGLLEREGRKYRPSWLLWELAQGSVLCRPDGPRTLALPLMVSLHAHTQGVVTFGVHRGSQVLVVEKIYGLDYVDSETRPGSRLPMTTTALGKAILAGIDPPGAPIDLPAELICATRYSITNPGRLREQIDAARDNGYAVELEESTLGVAAVASAVLRGSRAVAALSVSVPTSRFSADALAPVVVQYARALSAALTPKAG